MMLGEVDKRLELSRPTRQPVQVDAEHAVDQPRLDVSNHLLIFRPLLSVERAPVIVYIDVRDGPTGDQQVVSRIQSQSQRNR